MTTRFKREGPQKYHRTDPNWQIPFGREETVPEKVAAGVLFIVAILLLLAMLGVS